MKRSLQVSAIRRIGIPADGDLIVMKESEFDDGTAQQILEFYQKVAPKRRVLLIQTEDVSSIRRITAAAFENVAREMGWTIEKGE